MTQQTGTLIRVNGDTVKVISTAKDGKLSFQQVYDLIGTDVIQIVKTKDGRDMWIDEEGKVKGKVPNPEATYLYIYGTADPIVGDVVVLDKPMRRNDAQRVR